MDYPLVTVFTLIYNTDPRYVIEAIESIRANNYPNLQHIIIDDCSPDIKPKQVVKSWIRENNYSCEFYEHKVNYGLCKTLNHVLELAKGEYLFGCSDDLITENRIRQDVETFLELNGDYAIVFGLSQQIDSNSIILPRVFPYLTLPIDDNYWKILLMGNCLSAPSTTYKTSVLKKVGGFNENIKFEDYEINLRLSKLGYKFKCNPNINSFYRIHNSNISNLLNFKLEDIKILSNFSNEPEIKPIMFALTWNMLLYKENGCKEALKIYENFFSYSLKLRIAALSPSILCTRVLNKFFRLNIL